MNVLVLAGGDLSYTQQICKLAQSANFIIAADSGLKHAKHLKIIPDIIVGDFDSASEGDLEAFKDVPREHHPEDKDLLDLELALNIVIEKNPGQTNIFGATGSRLDQSLAALLIAARYKQSGYNLSLFTGRQDIYFMSGNESRIFDLAKNSLFSVLSLMDSSIISVKNARFNLKHHSLKFGVGLGVSNQVVRSPLEIELDLGLITLIVEHDE